jgi:TRAP-type C4-dicarboxylate transport system substrate-binding protein
MRKSFFFMLLLTCFILAACNQTSTTKETKPAKESADNGKAIELTYAFFAPANTFPAVQMEKWADEVEKRTEGKVKIKTFPGGSLLTAENMYEGVANGIADIGLSATTYEPGRFPLLAISDMPSDYPNATVASKVVNQLVTEYPPEALQNFKIITSFATEPAYIQSKTSITSLKELKGQQLRISGGLTPIMEALGAAPVGMAQSETPEALQTGIIDGYVSSREVLMDMKLGEMVKYSTDYPLTVTSFVAVMNKNVWNSLPEDVQKVIDDLNTEMASYTGEYLDQHVQKSLDWSKEKEGFETVSLSNEEKTKWDEIITPLQDNYVNKLEKEGLPAKKYHQRLYELIKEHSKE